MNIPVGKAACFLANVLVAGAIIIFTAGFFPYKPFLPGLATWSVAEDGPPVSAPFDRLIFMVVDALRRYSAPFPTHVPFFDMQRSDFVYSPTSNFSYTHEYGILHNAKVD